MSLIVKKFGGTSVGSLERIELVAEKILKFKQDKNQVLVVVSAMQGETDQLQSLAYKITPNPDLREKAALLATGEQIVISLLCMALIKRGCPARSYTGLQLGIETDGIINNAKVKQINTDNIKKDLNDGKVVVVAGFQGVDQNGNISLLGRGGSDITAVAIAIALEANECFIYTDVNGVYTADPNLVNNAKKLNSIDFIEMLELSGLGAKVMQIRAVELGSYYNFPIKVLSSFEEDSNNVGTIITKQRNNLEYTPIIKLAALKNQVKCFIKNTNSNTLDPKYINVILESLANLDVAFDMFSYDNNKISFVISNQQLEECRNTLNLHNLPMLTFNWIHIAKLSLVGLGLCSNPKIINQIYKSLFNENVTIYQVISSETKVSIILNEIDLEKATKILHATFLQEAQEAQEVQEVQEEVQDKIYSKF